MISSTQALTQATLTGAGQTIAISWPFLASSDLTVIQTRSGVDTLLVLNTDYTVTGGGIIPAAGNVVMVAGLNGDIITVYRSVPLTQTTQLTTLSAIPAKTLETTYDRLVMQIQELQNSVQHALRVPLTNDATSDMALANRKGNVVGFDSSGNLTFYSISGGIVAAQSIAGTSGQILVNGTFGTPQTGACVLTLATGGLSTITGTANQVLANGTSGSPQSGAVTLTLPQSIDTAAQVRFARIGLNVAPANTTDLLITRSVPPSSAQASVVVQGGLTAAYDLHPNAFRDVTVFTPTVAADGYCSFDAQTTMAGTVALNHYRGFQVRHGYTGTGTLGEMTGFMTANMGLSGTGTVTFLRGFYVSNASISGGGTVGQFDGIYMDQLSNATGLVNAIYIAGNNRLFMGGGQIVTSVDLTPPAGATTARGAFTFDQSSQTGLAVMNKSVTGTGIMYGVYNNGGTYQGGVVQTNLTTTAFSTSSDSRLKENVRDLSDVGTIIDLIQPRIFDWRWGGKDAHGFIAQELHAAYAPAVHVGENDADGNMARPWAVDNSKLVPLLMAEVKHLRNRVAQLETA